MLEKEKKKKRNKELSEVRVFGFKSRIGNGSYFKDFPNKKSANFVQNPYG